VVAIDPGHQGHGNNSPEPIGPGSSTTKPKVTSGTQGTATGKLESQLNLEVSLKLRKLFEAQGVKVVMVPLTDDDPLPFAEGEFDLVLNRHSGFNSNEVARVLAKGGAFLTQQVHGLWADDLLAAFDATPQWPTSTPDKYAPELEAAGLTVLDMREWAGQLAFTDVGAIVYYLKAVPWLVPGFSVETHLSYLLKLHDKQEKGQALAFAARKYLIEARAESQRR